MRSYPFPHIFRLVIAIGICSTFPLSTAAQETVRTIENMAQAINRAQSYVYGESGDALEYIRAEVVRIQQKPDPRNELANLMAALLDDPGSSEAFRIFVCQQLYLIGGEEQIDELLPLLLNPKYAHAARYALEAMPTPRADEALWSAIEKVDGPVAAGMVSSLARRKGPDIARRLAQLLHHAHEDVVLAALIGLGQLGSEEAEGALKQARSALPETVYTEYFEALLACAHAYRLSANTVNATRIFQELLSPGHPEFLRLAALQGLVDTQDEEAVPHLLNALRLGERHWVAAVCGHVRTVGGTQTTLAVADLLPELPATTQLAVIEALADRGDPAALDALLAISSQPDPDIRYAVASALGALGNETHVALLLDLLAGEDEQLAKQARQSLLELADVGVNGALLRELDATTAEFQPPIMALLAERRAVGAIPTLLDYALHDEGPVQQAAFRALGPLVSIGDIAQLYGAFRTTEDEATRTVAGEALYAAFRRIPSGDTRTELISTLYDTTTTSAVKGGLLQLLQQLGDDALLPLVRMSLASSNSLETQFATEALLAWPTPTPLPDAYALAEQADTPARKAAALQGYLRMLPLAGSLDDSTKLASYRKARHLATEPETLRLLLAGVAQLTSEAALDFAEEFLTMEGLRNEAAIAAEQIRSTFYTATASLNSDDALLTIDGNEGTSWQSGSPQENGQWVEIDLFRPAVVRGLVINFSRDVDKLPREYAIYAGRPKPTTPAESPDAAPKPEVPVATGQTTDRRVSIEFPPVNAQWIRIVQTGSGVETPWEIREIQVLPQ